MVANSGYQSSRWQAEGAPPVFARARFGWSVGEVSGLLGDLGTFLPHIVGAITVDPLRGYDSAQAPAPGMLGRHSH